MNFAKFLRAPLVTEHLWATVLSIESEIAKALCDFYVCSVYFILVLASTKKVRIFGLENGNPALYASLIQKFLQRLSDKSESKTEERDNETEIKN